MQSKELVKHLRHHHTNQALVTQSIGLKSDRIGATKPKADQNPGTQQTTNSAMQLYFCVKFLNTIKLFLDTPVQDKHEDFIKISDS